MPVDTAGAHPVYTGAVGRVCAWTRQVAVRGGQVVIVWISSMTQFLGWQMNESVEPPNLWRLMVVIGCTLMALAVIGGGYAVVREYSKYRKTKAIIATINTGLELCIGGKGGRQQVPLDFTYLQRAFATLSIAGDLRALQTIDPQSQWFVDGWGRLILRVGPNGDSFEVISAGRDGLHGTSDDLRN